LHPKHRCCTLRPMVKTIILVAISLLALALVPGCDKDAQAKSAVRESFDLLLFYEQNRNGREAVKLYTENSFPRYERLIRIALDGTPEQVRALPVMDIYEVLIMRTMGTRRELTKLSGKQYLELATSRGWWGPDDGSEYVLRDIRINGDSATAEVVIDRWRSGVRIGFSREGDIWKYDDEFSSQSWNDPIRNWAREAGMTVEQFVIDWIEEDHDREVPVTVWGPMAR
jgi:hypothetical protein